jgi:hypothetical protein
MNIPSGQLHNSTLPAGNRKYKDTRKGAFAQEIKDSLTMMIGENRHSKNSSLKTYISAFPKKLEGLVVALSKGHIYRCHFDATFI